MRRIGTKYILPPFDFQNVDCRCADKTDTWLKIKIFLAVVVFLVFIVFLIYHLMDENPKEQLEEAKEK